MFTGELRPYQNLAVDGCLELGYGLVAYGQGLGKTPVCIAIVEELLSKPEINFALLIVPGTLKDQWAQSIAKFTDVTTKQKKVKDELITIPEDQWCVIVDGDKKKRKEQYSYIAANWPNYVVISYETLVADYKDVEALNPEFVCLDEASFIKGFRAQRSKLVKKLGRKADITIALTGTPVENRLEELYSIMEFVEPGYLGIFQSFDAKYIVRDRFGRVKRYKNIDVLHEKLSKVMFRKNREDPDVAPYMPDVEYRDEYVFLSPKIQKLYDHIAELALGDLTQIKSSKKFDLAALYAGLGGDMSEQGKLMAKINALQMLCNDPRLLVTSAQNLLDPEKSGGSAFAAELAAEGLLVGIEKEKSAKLKWLKENVPNLLDASLNSKLIIFSFYKDFGRYIKEELKQYDSVLYNGDMNLAARTAAKARFQNNPECRIFIASDAGAYGVDLPQANYLINADFVYSAGKMDQRDSRHIRTGSLHNKVYVINLIADGSIDEQRKSVIDSKKSAARGIVDGQGLKDGGVDNTAEALGAFLSDSLALDSEEVSN